MKYIAILIIAALSLKGTAQEKKRISVTKGNVFLVLFYNTENFFDTQDDPKTDDNDFLPQGKMHWTNEKFDRKCQNLSRMLLGIDVEPPSLIGLAEIENRKVVSDFINQTPLRKYGYKIVHAESPDPRGIDVALMYREDQFIPLVSHFLKVERVAKTTFRTRDILYCKGIAMLKDTVHVYVNHWPSRRGGQTRSASFRALAAKRLQMSVDSVLATNPAAKIVIMGDFNDEPDDKSLTKVLKASTEQADTDDYQLINLSAQWLRDTPQKGTHCFKLKWSVLDQFIVSKALVGATEGLRCGISDARIVSDCFLLNYNTEKQVYTTFSTYSGFQYTGGFSDHLPIYLTLRVK